MKLANKFLDADASRVGGCTLIACGLLAVFAIAALVSGIVGLLFWLWRVALGGA